MAAGLLTLLLNSALVAWVARRLAGGFETAGNRVIAVLLLLPLQVVAGGLLLGYAGLLSGPALTGLHLIGAGLAWRFLPATSAIAFPVRLGELTAAQRFTLAIGVLLLLVWLVTALAGQVLIHDALTYRLSRVAHWLQTGDIRHFPTNELRQSYHPVNVDLVMLWLTAPFPRGYPAVQFAQFYGGVMLLAATLGLARECGLGRDGQFMAAAAMLALPNVGVQWTGAQSDLLTAGLLWCGVLMLVRRPDHRGHVALGWSGIAAAVGAKGTVLYLAFGLVPLVVCWWVSSGRPATDWRRHLALGLPALLLLAAPRYVENQLRFGNPIAPASEYALNHGDAERTDWAKKTGLNLASYFLQTLEPASNAPGFEQISRPVWSRLVDALPEEDPYDNRIYPRREYLHAFGPTDRPGADTISTGWPIPLLAGLGALGMLFGRRDQYWWRFTGMAACGVVFLIVFSALFLWWPTSFRYFSLAVPMLALPAARLLERHSARALVALTLLAALTAGDTYWRTKNAGRAQFGPDPAELQYVADLENQRAIVNELVPADGTVAVLLPWNSPLTGFYRQTNAVRVVLVPEAELRRLPDVEYLGERGWSAVITPPVPVAVPASGMKYVGVAHRITGQPQYLVHLPE